MFTKDGDYYEENWCPDCGMPTDSQGDCPNPLCPAKNADIEALTQEEDDK